MNNSYDNLLRNLHIVQYELKERNDPTLNICINYIQEAMSCAKKMDLEMTKLNTVLVSYRRDVDLDVGDCWD